MVARVRLILWGSTHTYTLFELFIHQFDLLCVSCFVLTGTFAVGRGKHLQFGNPPCIADLTEDQQVGFIKPYMQFNRRPGVPLFGITSSVMSDLSFGSIKLAATEFNTGRMIVTQEAFNATEGPRSANFVKLYEQDSNGNLVLLEFGFNSLVINDLNLTDPGGARGDARVFKYPDGTAGVFIERTGQFFKINEISSSSGDSTPTCSVIPLGDIDDVEVKVSYQNRVPAKNTAPSSYNMAVVEGFSDRLIFVDQKEGILFSYNVKSDVVTKIYDISAAGSDSPPAGTETNHGAPVIPFSNAIHKIHQVSPGPGDSIFVVFTSNVVPPGYSHPVPALPSEPEYHLDTWEGGSECANKNATELQGICGYGVRGGPFGGSFAAPHCCNGVTVRRLNLLLTCLLCLISSFELVHFLLVL